MCRTCIKHERVKPIAHNQTAYVSNVFSHELLSSAPSPVLKAGCMLSDSSAVGML